MSEHRPSAPTILVVDDDPDIQIALRARLTANGYQVRFAADGAGALSAATQHVPDLILLDVRLPKEDGFGVLARLKRIPELSQVPVVMLSAQDPASTEPRALEGGATAYCRKPFTSDELLGAIAGALRR